MLPTVIRAVLDTIQPKWTVETIDALAEHPLRYTDLVHTLTIARNETVYSRTITSVLRNLEDKGIVEHPPAGDNGAPYRLTPEGHAFKALLDYIGKWGIRHGRSLGM